MVAPLTKEQKGEIKNKFLDYKNKDKTLKEIGDELGLEQSTIGKHFLKYFGKEYRKIAKIRPYKHNTKLSNEMVFALFEEYKKGAFMKTLAKRSGVEHGSLIARMSRLIGSEYHKISKERRVWDSGKNRQKVSDIEIRRAFEKYKSNNISLTDLGKKLGITENSLISRFERSFGKEYKKIAFKRRDERKVSKKEYIKAFQEYKDTNISLVDLANKLNVRISSIRPRFLNLFGEKYIRVAKEKLGGSLLNHKGELAEYLAGVYLKMVGINIKDVRGKAILKNTLKRPDFVVDNTFIEIKSYFINLLNTRKRLKGYKDIINDYYGKETKDGTALTKGIIISLGGFSQSVWKKAQKEGITLIDGKNMKRRFEDENRTDLLEVFEDLKGYG